MKIREFFRPLVSQICGHETELHDLRNQLQSELLAHEITRSQVRQLAAHRDLLDHQVIDLSAQLEETREELTAVAASRDDLNLRLTTAETKAEERRATIEDLARELEAAATECCELKARADKSEAVIAMAVARLGGYVEGLPTARHNFLQRVDALCSFEAHAQEELDAARARIVQLEAGLDLDEDDLDEQQQLLHAPFVEAGGEAPVLISDSTSEQSYRLVGIFFEGRSHWVLARGDERIKAPIHDHAFLEQMKRQEVSFTSGDTLRAMVRVEGWRKPDGNTYAVYSVEQVLEIIHPDEQLELPAVAGEEAAHA